MKSIKLSKILFNIFSIYYLSYNTYFGWNKTPQSTVEDWFDKIGLFLLAITIILYLKPLFRMYESKVKKFEK